MVSNLLENILGAVSNGILELLTELLFDLIRIQFDVVAVNLEEMLVDFNVDVSQIEAKALELTRVVELLQGNDCGLELLLEVV